MIVLTLMSSAKILEAAEGDVQPVPSCPPKGEEEDDA